jgi:hypothetical protein
LLKFATAWRRLIADGIDAAGDREPSAGADPDRPALRALPAPDKPATGGYDETGIVEPLLRPAVGQDRRFF